MIRQAERVIVVADGSKVGRVELARICPIEAVHDLVTDADADPDALAALRAAGTTIHLTTG
jgi:DeoR family transcriptional regulator of aga operon